MSGSRDRWVRYGLIGLAVLGGLGVLGILAIFGLIAAEPWSDQPAMPRTVQAQEGTQAAVFAIGDVHAIAGTRLVRMPVSIAGSDRGGYIGATSDERNVLILDSATGQSRRLLPDNGRRIHSAVYLPATASRDILLVAPSDRVPLSEVFYLLEVERRDGKLRDIVVGRIAGGPAATVLQGVDGIDSPWMTDTGRVAMIAREQNRLVFRSIDLVAQTAAPAVPIEIGR